MDPQQFDLVVLGGGPAGITAALRARELDASVALGERGRLGGTAMNDGVTPARVLAHTARLMRDAQQFAAYGLAAAPLKLDLPAVLARARATVERLHDKKRLVHHLRQCGVQTFEHAGEARFKDPHSIVLDDSTVLQAAKFIICAGGYARRIVFPGSEHAINHTGLWALDRLPQSLIIVGGAATGCQLATCFNSFGTRVTILEMSPRILAIEDEAVGTAMLNAFQERGIDVVTGLGGVQQIDKDGSELSLSYLLGGESQQIQAEAILLAVGWAGNVEGLNLQAAGVQSERGHIVVNDYLQSSAPHIYAAGDITGRMMLVQSGEEEGRVAAENAVLGAGQPTRHRVVPHGGYTDPEYGAVGLTEAKAREQEECIAVTVPYRDMDRAVIDDHTEGFCKLIVSTERHRVLGAHVVGEQALESVQLVATAIAADMWVEDLAEVEIAYPTYTGIVSLAARRASEQLGVVPVAEQWRHLGQTLPAEWESTDE